MQLADLGGVARSCVKLLEMCGVVRRSAELEGLRRICWELFGVRWNKMVTAEFAELWELAEVHCVMGLFKGRNMDSVDAKLHLAAKIMRKLRLLPIFIVLLHTLGMWIMRGKQVTTLKEACVPGSRSWCQW